jgi:probable HAF family extracellular repeat protein
MKPRTAKRLIAAAIVAAVLTVTILIWPPRPEYEITDLGFCGKSGRASAINNAGQVASWSRYYSGSPARNIAFVWDAVNGRNDLQTPKGKESFTNDINDKGQVVGGLWEAVTSKWCAFIWDEETGITELGTLGGNSSRAEAVNNKAQVVGWADTPNGQRHAFIWDKINGMQDLGTLGGNSSVAMDINDKGQVVGSSSLANGRTRAFLWEQSAGMTNIGTLGGPTSHANAINNSGQVVGTSAKKGRDRGFIWESSKGITELNLPGRQNYALEINDQGQIIGYFKTGEFLFLKFLAGWCLWDSKQGAIDIDSIAQSLQWVGNINNKGQIVAIQPSKSGQNHIIILTPKAKSKPRDE